MAIPKIVPAAMAGGVLFMVILALGLPWYTMKQGPLTVDYKWDGGHYSGGGFSGKSKWDSSSKHTHSVFNTALAFTVLAFLVSVVWVLVEAARAIPAIGDKIPESLPKALIVTAAGIATVVLLFLAFVIFAGALPGAMKKDAGKQSDDEPQSKCQKQMYSKFSGSCKDEEGNKWSWGPASGWVFCLLSFFLALGTIIVGRLTSSASYDEL